MRGDYWSSRSSGRLEMIGSIRDFNIIVPMLPLRKLSIQWFRKRLSNSLAVRWSEVSRKCMCRYCSQDRTTSVQSVPLMSQRFFRNIICGQVNENWRRRFRIDDATLLTIRIWSGTQIFIISTRVVGLLHRSTIDFKCALVLNCYWMKALPRQITHSVKYCSNFLFPIQFGPNSKVIFNEF
jgi:hypothetical protein